MRDARWTELFERYRSHGDVEALAELFDGVGPALLKVARHLDSRRGEAEDLVQTTFLVAIERAGTYDATRPLMPWLMGVLINQSRIARRRRKELVDGGEHETSAESTQHADVEASELAKAVTKALTELPETYREVLIAHLQEGKKPRDIARELGRPQGTVRAQLHRGLRLMRDLLPASFALGFIALLAPRSLATVRRNVLFEAQRRAAGPSATGGSTAASAGAHGAAAVAARSLALLLVVLAAGLCVWSLMSAPSPPDVASVPQVTRAEVPAPGAIDPADADAPVAPPPHVRILAAEPGTPGVGADRGCVVVRVTRVGSEAPVAGALVSLLPWNEERWYSRVRDARTGTDGSAVFTDLSPGTVGLHIERGEQSRVDVVAGRIMELAVVIHPTIDVAGRVVDEHGHPVPGAEVGLYFADGTRTTDAPVHTDRDGRFLLERAEPERCIGARAAGFGAGGLLALTAPTHSDEARRALTLVLERRARTLVGRVTGTDGVALAGARVRVANGSPARVVWRADGFAEYAPPPAECLSSAGGDFSLEGLALGPLELSVELEGWARWSARLESARPGRVEEQRDVRLERGAVLSGHLRLVSGAPAAGAEVVVEDGAWRAFADEAGRYELRVPAGGHAVLVRRDRFAEPVVARMLLVDGEERAFDAELELAPTIRGTARGADGSPLAGVLVRSAPEPREGDAARARGAPWADPLFEPDDLLQAVTDARGAFVLPAYAGRLHTLEARRRAHWRGPVQARVEHVLAGREGVELRSGVRTAWFVGQIVDARGRALDGGQLFTSSGPRTDTARALIDPANGCFRLGPLFPGACRLLLCRTGEPPIDLGTFEASSLEERDVGRLALPDTSRVELRGAGPFTLLGKDELERLLVPDEEGVWSAERVPPGGYSILRAAVPTGARVEVRAGVTARMDLD